MPHPTCACTVHSLQQRQVQAAVIAELRLRKLQHLLTPLTLLRLASSAAAAPIAATQPQQPLQQPLRLLVLRACCRRGWHLVAVELQARPAASAAAAAVESCKQLRLCCWVRQA